VNQSISSIGLLWLCAQVALAQNTVPTKATFIVRDQNGQPVANAAVDGGFGDVTQAGARDRFEGETSTNGTFIASGAAQLDVGARFRKQGSYETITRVPVPRGKGPKLERWDVEIPVVLKRIEKPIPMYARQVRNPYVSLFESVGKYRLDQTARYDMAKGAFLLPDGNGEIADMVFKWKMTISAINKVGRAITYDTLCTIGMTNVVDGICKGTPDGSEDRQIGSRYLSGYGAPADGYTNAITLYRNVRGTVAESNDDQHYLYYFRIRTQTNEMGQVTNALYGKIYGQINGNFSYYLNPAPNDRNVEFDPAKNLFTGLSSREQVHEP
jgi:hypothetical protein